jgi:hypothetical protein
MESLEDTQVSLADENKKKNETLTTELHFELLKQYAWLASAGIGAMIFLIQLKVVEMGNDVYIAFASLGLSIFFAIMGQDHIVDSLLKGKDIYKTSKILKLIRVASMICLGFGGGYFPLSLI